MIVIVAGIVTGLISAWIAANLALLRYRSERWWDRKAEAYRSILEALHHAKAFYKMLLEEIELEVQPSKERADELEKHFQNALDEIQRATDIGCLFLSKAAVDRLEVYKKEAQMAGRQPSPYDCYDLRSAAVSQCLADMIAEARKDLRPTSRFLHVWPRG